VSDSTMLRPSCAVTAWCSGCLFSGGPAVSDTRISSPPCTASTAGALWQRCSRLGSRAARSAWCLNDGRALRERERERERERQAGATQASFCMRELGR
jgi:hypothetical protein